MASRPVGKALNLHGHGQRERQVRGPMQPGSPPIQVLLTLRRYLCRSCGATLTVGPRGLLTGRLFSAAAVALALCLWGLEKLRQAQVYAQVNCWRRPQEQAAHPWRQLGRWARGIVQRRLFRDLLPGPPPPAPQEVAARAAAALSARCPPALCKEPMRQQVFAGAALAA